MTSAKFWVISLVGSAALFLAILVTVFATGQTFGQRCSVIFPDKGEAWSRCVTNLSQGRPPQ